MSQGSLAENPLIFKSIHVSWISNWLTSQWIESQSERLSYQLKAQAIESEILWIWSHLQIASLESQINYLNLKPLESQINHRQSNPLNLEPIDNQTAWIWNQLTTKSLELQNNWIANHLHLNSIDFHISKQLNLKWAENQKLEPQTNGISKHLNLKSIDAKQLNLKSIDFQTNSISDLLPIGSFSLETSAAASCGRYVKTLLLYTFVGHSYLRMWRHCFRVKVANTWLPRAKHCWPAVFHVAACKPLL